jgi:hypothetical protein
MPSNLPRIRSYLPSPTVIGGLLFLLVIGGATLLAARSTGHSESAGLLWAGIWAALGIRIWIKWGWEDLFSIPACFALAVLSVAAGYNWI